MQDQKIAKNLPSRHHRATSSGYIFASKACIDNSKKMLNSNVSLTWPDNMVNFGPLAVENCWRAWGTRANFNRFRILAVLLHGTLVVGVSQTLQYITEAHLYSATLGIGLSSTMGLSPADDSWTQYIRGIAITHHINYD